MSIDDAIARANRAAGILADPIVAEAFADLEATYLAAWRTSPVRDAQAREALYHMLTALDAVKRQFLAHVEGGKIAADNIEAERRSAAVYGIPGATG